MKNINIIVEGSSEEIFVNDVLKPHFASMNKYVYARKIATGWDSLYNKPAKGGFREYSTFRNDVLRWIQSDNNKSDTFYTSFIDLYAFPRDSESPYNDSLQKISNHYKKIVSLEEAIAKDINHANFIPYVQLHEFEALLMVNVNKLQVLYPDSEINIKRLKKEIGERNPEDINESPQTAPSKRIIKYLPDYAGQKAQAGPLVAAEIGLPLLREKCPHFNEWITKLENL